MNIMHTNFIWMFICPIAFFFNIDIILNYPLSSFTLSWKQRTCKNIAAQYGSHDPVVPIRR